MSRALFQQQSQQQRTRWLRDHRGKRICAGGVLKSEMARQRVEVDAVHDRVAIEIAIRPALCASAEAGGYGVEVQAIDDAIEVCVTVFTVKDRVDECIDIGLVGG